jgi:hypothetical protein
MTLRVQNGGVATPEVTEVSDEDRRLGWIATRAALTQIRGIQSLELSIVRLLSAAAGLAVLLYWGLVPFLIGLALFFTVALAPVVHRLARGRVWEARGEPGQRRQDRVIGWAVVTPHQLNRHAWRLDLILHPCHKANDIWAEPLLEQVHHAAEVLGVTLESSNPRDRHILEKHGYLYGTTQLSRRPVILRFPSPDSARTAEGSLLGALSAHSDHPNDLAILARLTQEILSWNADSLSGPINVGWDQVVLSRRSQAWQLARASAACLDGYIENLATGRLDPASLPGGDQELQRIVGQLKARLRGTTQFLRRTIEQSQADLEGAGHRALAWAQELAHLEIDGLLLSGLVATARRRTGVALGILDPSVVDDIRDAAVHVRRRARALCRRAWFDDEKVAWWALAVASDALDLCGRPLARITLRRAIRKLEFNALRYLTLTVRPPGGRISGAAHRASRIDDLWSELADSQPVEHRRQSLLTPLSAVRLKRIGEARGAEGLRVKLFRRELIDLITNLLLVLLLGVATWLVTVVLVHPPWAYLQNVLSLLDRYFKDGGDSRQETGRFGWNLGVSTDLALQATIGLLAAVITAAVAVAVATPRESSIRLWSQDRAWQVFLVAIGYATAVAALVISIAPLAAWSSSLTLSEKAQAIASLAFAVLAAASAVSVSALETRLDDWQQRRRRTLAAARLRRAHARLGVSPGIPRLIARGLGCFGLCMLLWFAFFFLLGDLTTREDVLFFALVTALFHLPPMSALTAIAVIHWADAWGLAGRVAKTIRILLVAMLLAMVAFLALMANAFADEVYIKIVFITIFLSPVVALAVFLLVARVNAFRPTAWTGPATFALHLALHLGRRNYLRATE